MANAINFVVGATNRPFVDALQRARTVARRVGSQIKRDFASLGRDIGHAVKTGITAAAAAAAAGIYVSIRAASDLGETMSKTSAIFNESAKDIVDWSQGSAKAFGMSKTQAMDAAATFGIFGKAAGKTGEDLSDFSTELTELAADFASFFNTSPEDAIVAIGAALRGENEPIRRYGVLLNDLVLRQRALSMGLVATTKEALSPQNKTLAAYAEILAQTKDAQGDFTRTSSGLANQERIVKARLKDISAELGRSFLPMVLASIEAFQIFLDTMGGKSASGFIQELSTWIKIIPAAFREANAIVSGIMAKLAATGNVLGATGWSFKEIMLGAWAAINAAGKLFVADLLQEIVTTAGVLQASFEFAFQKAVEFFDNQIRDTILFLQSGVEAGIQKAFASIGKIPVIGKMTGLEGFEPESMSQIQKRNKENAPSGERFEAQPIADIAKRVMDGFSKGFFGSAVKNLRDSATRSMFESEAWFKTAGRRIKNGPDAFDAQGFRDDAKFFRGQSQQAVDSAFQEAIPKPQKKDPYANFATANKSWMLNEKRSWLMDQPKTSSLTPPGVVGLRTAKEIRESKLKEKEQGQKERADKGPEGTNQRLDKIIKVMETAWTSEQ